MSFRVLAVTLSFLVGFAFSASPTFAQVPERLSSAEWTSIRAAYEDGRHRVFEDDGRFEARSHRQQYVSRFDGRGVSIAPDDGAWSFEMTLTGYGRGDEIVQVSSPISTSRASRRIEYRWDERVTEWYVNGDDGLEHGFTVASPPSGSANLEFVLEVQGGMRGVVDPDERGATFVDAQGRDVVHYRGLFVVDATGAALAARITCDGAGLTIHVDDESAIYPIVIDPIVQQAYVKASNTDNDDGFGGTVAVSGNTVVVGASAEDSNATGVNGNQVDNSSSDSGAVYVFIRSGSTWAQQAYLKASNAGSFDAFGTEVAIDGDTVVVGAIFEDSNATGVNGNQANNSSSGSGAAYVFTRSGSTWAQRAYLKASNTGPGDVFGSDVAIDGDTVVVGSPGEDSNAAGVNGNQANNSLDEAGAAYVFTRSGSAWLQQSYLKASNTGANDRFGVCVDVDGDTVVVGAVLEASNATGVNGNQANNSSSASGAAYVFTRSGFTWAQQTYLKASNTGTDDRFGSSASIDGDTIVVGAYGEESSATGVDGDQVDNSSSESGAAYVFARSGFTWAQQAYLKASNTSSGAQFSRGVAIDGDTVVVGGYGEDSSATGFNGNQSDSSSINSGAVYVFKRNGSTWAQQVYLKASNTGSGDFFGFRVAIDGDTVVVGATRESSDSTGVNGDEANNSSTNSGAVYIFELDSDWRVILGCHGNTASYVVPSAPAQIDSTVPIDLLGSVVSTGIVATYYGATGIDAFGCGFQLSATEELLLAFTPFPTLYAYSAMTGGLSTMPLTLPNKPSLVGLVVTLQSVAIDTTTFASEFSDALEFVIRP